MSIPRPKHMVRQTYPKAFSFRIKDQVVIYVGTQEIGRGNCYVQAWRSAALKIKATGSGAG